MWLNIKMFFKAFLIRIKGVNYDVSLYTYYRKPSISIQLACKKINMTVNTSGKLNCFELILTWDSSYEHDTCNKREKSLFNVKQALSAIKLGYMSYIAFVCLLDQYLILWL